MAVFDPGGGGGGISPLTENENDALAQPFELYGFSMETLSQINEMFRQLYASMQRRYAQLASLTTSVSQAVARLDTAEADILTLQTSGGGVQSVTLTISTAQWDTLDTVPLVLIPAIVGSVIVPLAWSHSTTKNAVAWAVSSVQLRAQYVGDTTSLMNQLDSGLGLAAAAVNRGHALAVTAGPFNATSGFDNVGKAIEVLTSTSVSSGGTRTASTSLTIWFFEFTP